MKNDGLFSDLEAPTRKFTTTMLKELKAFLRKEHYTTIRKQINNERVRVFEDVKMSEIKYEKIQ